MVLVEIHYIRLRAGRSCHTNLLLFKDIVAKEVDEGLPVDVVY